MQTIYQNTELGYSRISLSDAIIMCPVMDKIISDYKWSLDKIKNGNNDDKEYYHRDAQRYYNQLKVMYQLGFVPTSAEDLIPLPALNIKAEDVQD